MELTGTNLRHTAGRDVDNIDAIKNFSHNSISPTKIRGTKTLIQRLTILLLCLTVLACPARGGSCCSNGDTGLELPEANNHCHCDHEHSQTSDDTPKLPSDYPSQCHDCFCAGALPPAVDVIELPDETELLVELVTIVLNIDHVRISGDNPFRLLHARPSSGRAFCTTYCTLLL